MAKGESQSFDIICNDGYIIWDILVDESSVGTPSTYNFSAVSRDHTIRAIFSMIPILPVEGAILEGQQDVTGNWEDKILDGDGLDLPAEALKELLDTRSAEILEVRKVALLNCSAPGESGISLQVGLEKNLPQCPADTCWALLFHDPLENRWELQGKPGITVEDGCPFDQNETDGKIEILVAEVLIEATSPSTGTGGDGGGCDTGLNPLPAFLLLLFHFARTRR